MAGSARHSAQVRKPDGTVETTRTESTDDNPGQGGKGAGTVLGQPWQLTLFDLSLSFKAVKVFGVGAVCDLPSQFGTERRSGNRLQEERSTTSSRVWAGCGSPRLLWVALSGCCYPGPGAFFVQRQLNTCESVPQAAKPDPRVVILASSQQLLRQRQIVVSPVPSVRVSSAAGVWAARLTAL